MADARDWEKEMAEIDRLLKKQGISVDEPASPTKDAPPAKGSPPAKSAGPAPPRAAASSTAVASPGPKRPAAVAPTGTPVLSGSMRLRLWTIALLGPLGAGGLVVWPYTKACGTGLGVYLVGVVGVIAAGLWTMRTAWVMRRGTVMVVGVMTLLAALALTALEVLPRVGYAANLLTWTCST